MEKRIVLLVFLISTCFCGLSAKVSYVKAYPTTSVNEAIYNELSQLTDSISLYFSPEYLEKEYYVLVVNYWEGFYQHISLKNRMKVSVIPKDDLSNSYWGNYVWRKSKVRKYGYCKFNNITALLVDIVSGRQYFEIDPNGETEKFELQSFPEGSVICTMDEHYVFIYENKPDELTLINSGYPQFEVRRKKDE